MSQSFNHQIYGSANGYGGNGGGINGEDGKRVFQIQFHKEENKMSHRMQDDTREMLVIMGNLGKGGDGSATLQQAAFSL